MENSTNEKVAYNENLHIYLCFGQSNMEGQAPIEACDKYNEKRFLMFRATAYSDFENFAGSFVQAQAPLAETSVGLSPVDYFGVSLLKELPEEISIGVVTVAVPGCDIRLFDKEQYNDYTETHPEQWFYDKITRYNNSPYHYLVAAAKQAQQYGVIKGILLHQGETNEGDNKWPHYVKKIYNDLLYDLKLTECDVPLIAGEVVHAEQNGECASMNNIIASLPSIIENAYIVGSRGCAVDSDMIHFNSAGTRLLGERYAKMALQKILHN